MGYKHLFQINLSNFSFNFLDLSRAISYASSLYAFTLSLDHQFSSSIYHLHSIWKLNYLNTLVINVQSYPFIMLPPNFPEKRVSMPWNENN